MDIISIIRPIAGLLSDEKSISITRHSLMKMFLIECKTNQKLLAIASWKDVSEGIRNEALKNISSENAKAFYAFSDQTILGKLLGKVSLNSPNETDREKASDNNKITSLITRTEALRFLGNIPNEIQNQSKAKYSIRISNLTSITLEVIEVLETQMKDI